MGLSRASFLFLLVSTGETSAPVFWIDWQAAFAPATLSSWTLAVLAFIASCIGLGTLRAALRAARAAENSNRQAREMAQVDLRAYVHVTNVGLSGELTYEGKLLDKLILTFRILADHQRSRFVLNEIGN